MRTLFALILGLLLARVTVAQKTISFPTEDGGLIFADVYGEGERAVVLAHGGRFNKESWAKQAQTLAAAGFRVLALDFRGYGKSKGAWRLAAHGCSASFGCACCRPLSADKRREDGFDCWRQHGRRSRRGCVDRFAAGCNQPCRIPWRVTERSGGKAQMCLAVHRGTR